ncbi:Cationic amino acid transporter 4 [Cichlidogyrus casuarinus]|uniref:Cationic amino acid transporter 4 n=1 Tax=Cichlidogyrus casuarinus TaxID=1844966 RepID=A0ABD2QCS0_9PLAT
MASQLIGPKTLAMSARTFEFQLHIQFKDSFREVLEKRGGDVKGPLSNASLIIWLGLLQRSFNSASVRIIGPEISGTVCSKYSQEQIREFFHHLPSDWYVMFPYDFKWKTVYQRHWSLLIISFEFDCMYHVDSLGTFNRQLAKKFGKKLAEAMNLKNKNLRKFGDSICIAEWIMNTEKLSRWMTAFRRKKRVEFSGETRLTRNLKIYHLTVLGVGSTLGAGLYVSTGYVARELAGPGVGLSYLFAAVACILAGLCYAEFGARLPTTGSPYLFSYVALGELVAFYMGLNVFMQYFIGVFSFLSLPDIFQWPHVPTQSTVQ